MVRALQASDYGQMGSLSGIPRERKHSPTNTVRAKEPAEKQPQTPLSKESTSKLLTYNEIPGWYQDNENIFYGYRPVSNSAIRCFASWAYVHNETFNIFSHLVPAMLSLASIGLLRRYFLERYPRASLGDQLVFGFFLSTVIIRLALSSTYHTLMNHSASVAKMWLRLDYVGILILTLGDFISGIYLVFFCEPSLQEIYWAMVMTAKTELP